MGHKGTWNVKDRLQFIQNYHRGQWSMAELCRRFGISRITGYKWVRRYQEGGVDALRDRSRAPHRHPFAILDAVEEALVAARREHPTWGPMKLRLWLERTAPEVQWPAASTIGEILRRNGLTNSPNRQKRVRKSTGRRKTRSGKRSK